MSVQHLEEHKMEEFLDNVEEHDTLYRIKGHEQEVIKPVMSEP